MSNDAKQNLREHLAQSRNFVNAWLKACEQVLATNAGDATALDNFAVQCAAVAAQISMAAGRAQEVAGDLLDHD